MDPKRPPESKVVHVRGLTPKITDKDLINLITRYGNVAYILMLPQNNQALIEFEKIEGARSLVLSTAPPSKPLTLFGVPCYFNFSTSQYIQRSKKELGHVNPKILLFTILNPKYPITVDVIKKICTPHGKVLKIVIFQKTELHALVQFPDDMTAYTIKTNLDGCDIYADCCTIKIDYARTDDLNVTKNDSLTWDACKEFTNTTTLLDINSAMASQIVPDSYNLLHLQQQQQLQQPQPVKEPTDDEVKAHPYYFRYFEQYLTSTGSESAARAAARAAALAAIKMEREDAQKKMKAEQEMLRAVALQAPPPSYFPPPHSPLYPNNPAAHYSQSIYPTPQPSPSITSSPSNFLPNHFLPTASHLPPSILGASPFHGGSLQPLRKPPNAVSSGNIQMTTMTYDNSNKYGRSVFERLGESTSKNNNNWTRESPNTHTTLNQMLQLQQHQQTNPPDSILGIPKNASVSEYYPTTKPYHHHSSLRAPTILHGKASSGPLPLLDIDPNVVILTPHSQSASSAISQNYPRFNGPLPPHHPLDPALGGILGPRPGGIHMGLHHHSPHAMLRYPSRPSSTHTYYTGNFSNAIPTAPKKFKASTLNPQTSTSNEIISSENSSATTVARNAATVDSEETTGKEDTSESGCNLFVTYGVDRKQMNCQMIFNLFSAFGIVVKVRFSGKKMDKVYVEMRDGHSVVKLLSACLVNGNPGMGPIVCEIPGGNMFNYNSKMNAFNRSFPFLTFSKHLDGTSVMEPKKEQFGIKIAPIYDSGLKIEDIEMRGPATNISTEQSMSTIQEEEPLLLDNSDNMSECSDKGDESSFKKVPSAVSAVPFSSSANVSHQVDEFDPTLLEPLIDGSSPFISDFTSRPIYRTNLFDETTTATSDGNNISEERLNIPTQLLEFVYVQMAPSPSLGLGDYGPTASLLMCNLPPTGITIELIRKLFESRGAPVPLGVILNITNSSPADLNNVKAPVNVDLLATTLTSNDSINLQENGSMESVNDEGKKDVVLGNNAHIESTQLISETQTTTIPLDKSKSIGKSPKNFVSEKLDKEKAALKNLSDSYNVLACREGEIIKSCCSTVILEYNSIADAIKALCMTNFIVMPYQDPKMPDSTPPLYFIIKMFFWDENRSVYSAGDQQNHAHPISRHHPQFASPHYHHPHHPSHIPPFYMSIPPPPHVLHMAQPLPGIMHSNGGTRGIKRKQ